MTFLYEAGRWVALGGLLVAGGCADDEGRPGGGLPNASGIGSAGDAGTGDGDGDGGGGSFGDDGDGDGSGGGGPKFDLSGGGGGDGLDAEEGCRAVDFLFVIDNSVSMEGEQAALVGAFPGFMDTIEATLSADSDYHVMVADTDAWGRCNTGNGWAGMDADSDTCNNYVKTTSFDECDRVRGAGVIHPAGQHASNMPCQPAGGHRYIEAGEPDLAGTFSCMAQVGVAGHPSERPMDAIVEAVSAPLNAPGACNEGFLRDDALLVVTFLSDDPNYEDADGPPQWYDAVVQAKLGDPSAVVVLGLTPNWDGCQDGKGPPKGSHWTEFLSMWGGNGLHGNVCGTSQEYIDFFAEAVSTIDQACDDYTPPG